MQSISCERAARFALPLPGPFSSLPNWAPTVKLLHLGRRIVKSFESADGDILGSSLRLHQFSSQLREHYAATLFLSVRPSNVTLQQLRVSPRKSLCLAARGLKERFLPVLDLVEVDYEVSPFASHYDGARPSFFIINEAPKEEDEISAIGRLAERASTFHWRMSTVLANDDLSPLLATLGPSFGLVTEFWFNPIVPFDAVCIESLVPHMKLLTSFYLSWVTNANAILTAVADSGLKLERLTIIGEPDVPLSSFKPALVRLTHLKMLMLPNLFFEISALNEILALEDDDFEPQSAETMISAISESLPEHLRDFKEVFLEIKTDDDAIVYVSFFGDLFRHCSTGTASTFILERLKEIGVNHIPHDDADTPLTNILTFAGGAPGKVKALIEAGADIYRLQSVLCPSSRVMSCLGSSLHCVVKNPHYARELFSSLDWTVVQANQWEKLRTSNGFTPLHVAADYHTWREIYEAVSPHFPEILSDRNNICNTTPMQSIHSVEMRDASANAVIEVALFINNQHPWALHESLPGLLSTALKYYSAMIHSISDVGRVQRFIDSIVHRMTSVCGIDLKNPEELTRDQLGFPNRESHPDHSPLDEGYCIFGTMLFARALLPVVIRGVPEQHLSAALAILSLNRRFLQTFRTDVETLRAAGAQLNTSDPAILHGMSILSLFAVATSSLLDSEEEVKPVDLNQFWSDFFYFTDAGAELLHCGKPVSISFRGPYGQPYIFWQWSDESPYLERFLAWIFQRSSQGQFEADLFEVIFNVRHQGNVANVAVCQRFLDQLPKPGLAQS